MISNTQFDFYDKFVLITGATRGIGKSIATHFSALGANLILTGTNPQEIELLNDSFAKNGRVKYYCVDFSNEELINEFISVLKNYDKIDICINNAGINRINFIYEVQLSDWDQIMKVNLRGPFLLSKEVGNIMKKQRYGRIINIASIFGVVTREKRSVYTASKAGLIGLTKATANDLAPYNILVNSVSPGFILTDLTRKILSDSEIKELETKVPLGRFGHPDEISKVVLFLASDLNTYITGQNIIVDGGYVNI